jgi:hypothetical protein
MLYVPFTHPVDGHVLARGDTCCWGMPAAVVLLLCGYACCCVVVPAAVCLCLLPWPAKSIV